MTNASVRVVSKQFTTESGELRPYKRLVIEGTVEGESLLVEFSGSREQMTLANLILRSSEKLEVKLNERKGNVDIEVVEDTDVPPYLNV